MQGAHTHIKPTCPAAASCTALSKLPSSSSPAPGPSVLYAVTPQISKFLSRGGTTSFPPLLPLPSQSLISLSRGYCWDASFLASHPLPPTMLLCYSSLPPSLATYQSKSRFIQHHGPRSSLSPKAFWLSSSRSSPGTPYLPLFSPSSMYLLPSSPLSHHCLYLFLAPQGSISMFHIKKASHMSEILKGSCNLTTLFPPHIPLLPSSLPAQERSHQLPPPSVRRRGSHR